MSLQSEHPPLTWSRIEQLAQAGHEQWQRAERLNATLERVREALKTTYPRDPVRALVEVALATRPEAPPVQNIYAPDAETLRDPLRVLVSADDGAEYRAGYEQAVKDLGASRAAKGPAAESDTSDTALIDGLSDSLVAANARIVTLDRGLGDEIRAHHETRVRELAANARIAEQARMLVDTNADLGQRILEANARADAAETLVTALRGSARDAYKMAQANAAERDQLAARVTELTEQRDISRDRCGALSLNQCTPEERNVLDALREIPDDDVQLALDLRDGMSGPERRMWKAELANRAAKAKREAT